MLFGFCECGREMVREDVMQGKRVKCPDCGRFVELVTEREAQKLRAAALAEADPLSALADAAQTVELPAQPQVQRTPRVAPSRAVQRRRRGNRGNVAVVVIVVAMLGGLVWLLATVNREIVNPGPQGVTFNMMVEPTRDRIFFVNFYLQPPGSGKRSYCSADYNDIGGTPADLELVADGKVIAGSSPVAAKTQGFWQYEIAPQTVEALMQATAFDARFGKIVLSQKPDEWADFKEFTRKSWQEKPR